MRRADDAYESYYTTGHYDRRYPIPNGLTLERVAKVVALGDYDHVVDFGSGNGRYLIPLLDRFDGLTATAVDSSLSAREQLRERLRVAGMDDRVSVCDALDEVVLPTSSRVLALALFGVVSHLADEAVRLTTLRQLSGMATDGRIVISVPNRYRRFPIEQGRRLVTREAPSSLIRYRRRFAEGTHEFEYQLYSASQLRRELRVARLRLHALHCESVMPESIVTSWSTAAALDEKVSRFVPPWLGYGMVAIADAVVDGRYS